MIFLFSPAKTQASIKNTMLKTFPSFIEKAKFINHSLNNLTHLQKQNIFKLSDALINKMEADIKDNKFDLNGTCAIYFYHGLQFKSANLINLNSPVNNNYMSQHIYILSSLYGILRASDSIYNYRLDFNNSFKINNASFYSFWSHEINSFLLENTIDDNLIINLASKEYAKVINFEKLSKHLQLITVEFKINKNNRWISQATQAKQARGYFLEFIIKNKVKNLDQILNFNSDGYQYNSALSNSKTIIFTK